MVFRGAFLSDNWGGWSDFLERVEALPSALRMFSYEVADTKLKRCPHPKHVLQLIRYLDLLTEIQGTASEFAHVELGKGTRDAAPIPLFHIRPHGAGTAGSFCR